MPKINLAIEADSATEMKEILSQLATGSVRSNAIFICTN